MPDYELHADYDRDGRLTLTTAEYSQRQTLPGVILLPNIDADGRALPKDASAGSAIKLDYEAPTKTGRDNDLLTLRVRVVKPSVAAGCRFYLKVIGGLANRVNLYDAYGHRLASAPGTFHQYPVVFSGSTLDLRIESSTLGGSPMAHPTTLDTTDISRPPDDPNLPIPQLPVDDPTVQLQLLCIDQSGNVKVFDRANVTIAPFLLFSCEDPVDRVYICQLPDNEPSVRDFRSGIAGFRGVSLVIVPVGDVAGDTWLQDQIEFGYCDSPSGSMTVVFHLPRLKSNVAQTAIPRAGSNLRNFIESHFPSSGVGLFQDFWHRSIPVSDSSGQVISLTFDQTIEVQLRMYTVILTYKWLSQMFWSLRISNMSQSTLSEVLQQRTWFEKLCFLKNLLKILRDAVLEDDKAALEEEKKAKKKGELPKEGITADERREFNRRRLAYGVTIVNQMGRNFPTTKKGVWLTFPGGGVSEVPGDEADRLYARLKQMHSSLNYGGNIEASPPLAGSPFGKILLGNVSRNVREKSGAEAVDPDLLRFLRKQQIQPLVEIDTTWLDVGHVDEIISFVYDRTRSTFALLRASSDLAIQLIEAARKLYVSGLPAGHPHHGEFRPSGILSRLTSEGHHPVTHMFRGKLWLHYLPKNAIGSIEPPLIYRSMAEADTQWRLPEQIPKGQRIQGIYYIPGEWQDDRLYPAAISILELLYFERDREGKSVNKFIETNFLATISKKLQSEFPKTLQVPLPVLFDKVTYLDGWEKDPSSDTTCAFSPNLANMQVVDGHLFVPRPYGPRMCPDDAIAVVMPLLAEYGLGQVAGSLNQRYLLNKRLTTTFCWIRREKQINTLSNKVIYKTPFWERRQSEIAFFKPIFSGIDNARDVAQYFLDGFPNQSVEKVTDAIRKANLRHFDGNGRLRDGWRLLTIPENTVDLFELWTQLAADVLNLDLHWVDSWYYHVRYGEIHCGTKVLRQPSRRRKTRWWETVVGAPTTPTASAG